MEDLLFAGHWLVFMLLALVVFYRVVERWLVEVLIVNYWTCSECSLRRTVETLNPVLA